jgi:hypothetical protein
MAWLTAVCARSWSVLFRVMRRNPSFARPHDSDAERGLGIVGNLYAKGYPAFLRPRRLFAPELKQLDGGATVEDHSDDHSF